MTSNKPKIAPLDSFSASHRDRQGCAIQLGSQASNSANVTKTRILSDLNAEINSTAFFLALLDSGRLGQKAFSRLEKEIKPLLAGLLARHLDKFSEREEAMQDILLAIHRALPGFEARSKLTTWIFGLAHHKVIDRVKGEIRRRRLIEEMEAEPLGVESEALEGTPWDLSPDRLLFESSLKNRIELAVHNLPEDYRMVWLGRDREGLSGDLVATQLGISEVAVRVRLHRARQMVAENVRGQLPMSLAA